MARLNNIFVHILGGIAAFGVTSCGDQSLLDGDVELRTHQTSSWSVPIATADASIADILSGNNVANDALISRNDSLILRLELSDLVNVQSLDDLVSTAGLQAQGQGKLPKGGYPLSMTIPAGALALMQGLYPVSEGQLELDLPSDVEEITELSFGLDLEFVVSNSPVGAEVKLTFPSIISETTGAAYEITAQVAAGQTSTNRVSTGTIRISSQSLSNVLSLPYRITVTPTTPQSAIQVTQGDGINYKLSASNLTLDKFAGKIKQITQTLPKKKTNWDFPIWEDLSGLKLSGSKLTFTVAANRLAGQATFDPVINFLGANNQVVSTWTGEHKDLSINAASTAAETTLEYRSEELQSLLSSIRGYGVELNAQVRFGGSVYLDRQATLDVDLALEQPVIIGLSGLNLEIPMAPPALDQLDKVRETFDQISLVLRSTSTVPLALECHALRLLDENKNPISGEASIPLSGKLIGGENPSGEISLTLTADQIAQLKRAKHIAIAATVSTPSSEPVLLRPSQRVQLQLSTILDVNLK